METFEGKGLEKPSPMLEFHIEVSFSLDLLSKSLCYVCESGLATHQYKSLSITDTQPITRRQNKYSHHCHRTTLMLTPPACSTTSIYVVTTRTITYKLYLPIQSQSALTQTNSISFRLISLKNTITNTITITTLRCHCHDQRNTVTSNFTTR